MTKWDLLCRVGIKRVRLPILTALAAALFTFGCSKSVAPDAQNKQVYQANIGPNGGMLEVTDAGSPLFGVKVTIPASALGKMTTIRLTQATDEPQPPFPGESQRVSPVIKLEPEGLEFLKQVDITLPYSLSSAGEHSDVMIFAFEEIGSHGLFTQEIDSLGRTITASTLRFSRTAAYAIPWLSSTPGLASSHFDISRDVLSVANPGNRCCAGMCNLALWYYLKYRCIPNSAYGDLRGRRTEDREIELAEDATDAIGQCIGIFPFYRRTPLERYLAYIKYITVSLALDVPVILYVNPIPPDEIGHYIIATSIAPSAGGHEILVYDPADPERLHFAVGTYLSYPPRITYGERIVDGATNAPTKPIAMNTVLHAGKWRFIPTLVRSNGFPCPVEMTSAQEIDLEIDPNDPLAVIATDSDTGRRLNITGTIGGSALTLQGHTDWEYTREECAFDETGTGTLEDFRIFFDTDLEFRDGGGLNSSKNCLAHMPGAWYEYKMTGTRPPNRTQRCHLTGPQGTLAISNQSDLFSSYTMSTAPSPCPDTTLVMEIDFPRTADYGESLPLVVRSGVAHDGVVDYQPGIHIVVAPLGGVVDPWEGNTDNDGYFRTRAELLAPFDCIKLTVVAVHPEGYYAVDSVQACQDIPHGCWLLAWGDSGSREFCYDPNALHTCGVVNQSGDLGIGFGYDNDTTATVQISNIASVELNNPVECHLMTILFPGDEGAVSPFRYDVGSPVQRTFVTFTELELPSGPGSIGRASGTIAGSLGVLYTTDWHWERVDIIHASFEDVTLLADSPLMAKLKNSLLLKNAPRKSTGVR